jgi:hypothetical protein
MKKMNNVKKAGALLAVCSVGLGVQAQVIDAFNGESLSSYTTTLVNDGGSGGTSSVSFSDSTGGLVASFAGTVSDPEQAVFLTSSTIPAGDSLVVSTTVPVSTTTEDLGIAISATATPPAAGANASTRANFDWASVSVRPSQGSIRVNTSIGGTLTTSADTLAAVSTSVSELFIENNGGGSFTLGYLDTSDVEHIAETFSFESGFTGVAAVGIYGDVRVAGTSLGSLSDLEYVPNTQVPEPTSLALFGIGLAGLGTILRRKSK